MHIYIHEAAVDCGLETIMKERNLQSFNLARIEATSKIERVYSSHGEIVVLQQVIKKQEINNIVKTKVAQAPVNVHIYRTSIHLIVFIIPDYNLTSIRCN